MLVFLSVTTLAQGILIGTGAFIKVSDQPRIEILDGNFTNNGNYIKDKENFVFSGTTAAEISGTSQNDFYNLIINNSGNVYQNSTGNTTITHSLVFSSGLYDTGSQMLIINDNATVSGAGSSTYINGTCRKIGDDAFVFPVGKDGKYAPIGISAPSDFADHFTATYINENPDPLYDVSLLGPGLTNVSTIEYWLLDRTNGSSSVSVTLFWDENSGVSQVSDLKVAEWNGSLWVDDGNQLTTGNSTSGSITSNVLDKFSPFTLGSLSTINPLPVDLLYFKTECANNNVKLIWATASEIDCDYFQVEKMIQGGSFVPIAQIPGNGNSNRIINYELEDDAAMNQINYYKLIQVDYSGVENEMSNSITYSNCNSNKDEFIVYQDVDGLSINISSAIEDEVVLYFYDTTGKLIKHVSKNVYAGDNIINTSDFGMSIGMYFLNVKSLTYNQTTRIIIK